jgi:PIN domain nuclease of toxin-antitoxin system
MSNSFLIDTHIILWWLDNPKKLSAQAREIIENARHTIYLSSASIWEIAIKSSIGRLRIPENLLKVLDEEDVKILSVSGAHAMSITSLPSIHSDPFDRMLVAQALHEDLQIITRDSVFERYEKLRLIPG